MKEEGKHIDQSELDKRERFKEQRRAVLADRILTAFLSLVAISVIGFLAWSFVVD